MSQNQFTVGDQINYSQGKDDAQKKSDEMKEEILKANKADERKDIHQKQDNKDNSENKEGMKKEMDQNNNKPIDNQTKNEDMDMNTSNNQMKNDRKEDQVDENVNGELTYDDKVIQKIIGIAMKEVDGLLTINGGFFSNMRDKLVNSDNVAEGINTEVGKKQVAVDMDIVAEYGKDIDEIFENIKKLIVREVKTMTHLDVIEVNVNVVDIKTREEFEADQESLQDKAEEAMSEREKEKAKEDKQENKNDKDTSDNSRVE